jgi:hypothetical protein
VRRERPVTGARYTLLGDQDGSKQGRLCALQEGRHKMRQHPQRRAARELVLGLESEAPDVYPHPCSSRRV